MILKVATADNFLSGGEAEMDIRPGTDLELSVRPLVQEGAPGLEQEAFDTRKCL